VKSMFSYGLNRWLSLWY